MKIKIKSLLALVAFALFTSFAFSCSTSTKEVEHKGKFSIDNLKAEKTYYFSSPIANIDNGKIRFIDYEETLKTFEQNFSLILSEKIKVHDIDIIVSENMFLFSANSSHGNSGIVLVQVGDVLYESSRTTAGSSKVTTCSGCKSTGPSSTHDCEATGNPGPSGGVYCSDCPEGSGDCIKNSSQSSKSILSNNSNVLAN